jgi:hypothetical protein
MSISRAAVTKGMMAVAVTLALALAAPAMARHHSPQRHGGDVGFENATVLIIRHAEKPDSGPGLSPQGEARARAYVSYFEHLQDAPSRVDNLVATKDSGDSQRPRLTLEPLSKASGLSIKQPFEDADVKSLAKWLRQGPSGRTTLIAWHHGEIPKLIAELGLDPAAVLPGGQWPDDVYDWVVVLQYDENGAIIPSASHLVHEPADLVPHTP